MFCFEPTIHTIKGKVRFSKFVNGCFRRFWTFEMESANKKIAPQAIFIYTG